MTTSDQEASVVVKVWQNSRPDEALSMVAGAIDELIRKAVSDALAEQWAEMVKEHSHCYTVERHDADIADLNARHAADKQLLIDKIQRLEGHTEEAQLGEGVDGLRDALDDITTKFNVMAKQFADPNADPKDLEIAALKEQLAQQKAEEKDRISKGSWRVTELTIATVERRHAEALAEVESSHAADKQKAVEEAGRNAYANAADTIAELRQAQSAERMRTAHAVVDAVDKNQANWQAYHEKYQSGVEERIEAAVRSEREACAKVAADWAERIFQENARARGWIGGGGWTASDIADAIRQRASPTDLPAPPDSKPTCETGPAHGTYIDGMPIYWSRCVGHFSGSCK